MNKEIEATLHELWINAEDKKKLQETLLKQHYEFFESKGVKKGSLVTIQSFGRETLGYYNGLYLECGQVKANVSALRTDGLPHESWKIPVYYLKNIKELGL